MERKKSFHTKLCLFFISFSLSFNSSSSFRRRLLLFSSFCFTIPHHSHSAHNKRCWVRCNASVLCALRLCELCIVLYAWLVCPVSCFEVFVFFFFSASSVFSLCVFSYYFCVFFSVAVCLHAGECTMCVLCRILTGYEQKKLHIASNTPILEESEWKRRYVFEAKTTTNRDDIHTRTVPTVVEKMKKNLTHTPRLFRTCRIHSLISTSCTCLVPVPCFTRFFFLSFSLSLTHFLSFSLSLAPSVDQTTIRCICVYCECRDYYYYFIHSMGISYSVCYSQWVKSLSNTFCVYWMYICVWVHSYVSS